MKLGFHNKSTNHFGVIRGLTENEVVDHAGHTKFVTEARNRLALFRMLSRNYDDLMNFVQTLLSAKYADQESDGEEIDRLLLNYLTFAYSIQQHFDVSYKARFKKDEAQMKRYKDFVDRLCNACWPFAFILDYRGFVQHVGLGVGRFHRKLTLSSVIIEVRADPARLVRGRPRDWERSKLSPEADEIDLLPVLREFHIQMLQSYGNFVATTFYPELLPAYDFYAALTDEAKRSDSNARMVFFSEEPEIIYGEGGKFSWNAQLVFPPNSLFEELGLIRPKAANKTQKENSEEEVQ